MNASERTADAFYALLREGHEQNQAIITLAQRYQIATGAIRSRLRRAGAIAECRPRRQLVHPQNVCVMPGDEIVSRRVDRDPCPRCAVRADIGCEHGRALRPLSNVVFA